MSEHTLEEFGLTPEVIEKLKVTAQDPVAREALTSQAAQGGAPPSEVPSSPPTTPEEVETNKGLWDTMLDNIANPDNPNSAIFQTGLNLLQPIQPGQSLGGKIGESLNVGVQSLVSGRKERTASERLAKQDTRQEKLDIQGAAESKANIARAEAGTEGIGATTALKQRKLGSADLRDDLLRSEIAKNLRENPTGKGAKAILKDKRYQNLLKSIIANQPNVETEEQAIEYVWREELRKGQPVLAGATEENIANIGVFGDKPRTQLATQQISSQQAAANVAPLSPQQQKTQQKTQQDWVRLNAVPKEQWTVIRGNAELRRNLEAEVGAELLQEFLNNNL